MGFIECLFAPDPPSGPSAGFPQQKELELAVTSSSSVKKDILQTLGKFLPRYIEIYLDKNKAIDSREGLDIAHGVKFEIWPLEFNKKSVC